MLSWITLILISMMWDAQVTVVLAETPGDSLTHPPVAPVVDLKQAADLNGMITRAFDHNPRIQAARETWQAAVEQIGVSAGWPDPQLMVSYFPDPIETRLGPQDWNASLSQTIPFPGKLATAGEVALAEAQIARLRLDQTVRDVVVAIRESYHELGYIRRARRIAEQNMKLLEHLRTVAETAYGDDKAVLLDVVKAQSQSGQLRYDLLLLNDLEQTEMVRLNGLLNREPGKALGPLATIGLQPLAYDLPEIYRLAEQYQEEVRIANQTIAKAKKNIALAKLKNRPDVKVGLFYAGIGEPDVRTPPNDAGRDAFGIQLGVTLPLWFGKNKSRVARAGAELRRAKAMRRASITDTRTRIRAVYFRLENARRIDRLYTLELLPQTARTLEIAETWMKQGESTFSDFIETQSIWYNFQLAQARARADYGKYLARLERLVGQRLTPVEKPLPTGRQPAVDPGGASVAGKEAS